MLRNKHCQIFIYILLVFLSFLENILILTLFLIVFAEFKVCVTQLFSSHSLKIVFHYILDSMGTHKMSAVNIKINRF